MTKPWKFVAGALIAAGALATAAQAGTYSVDVGYADFIRANGYFPNPWIGNSIAVTLNPGDYGNDNGAVGFDNRNGSSALTISNFSYTINYGGPYTIGGTLTVPVGDFGIIVLGDTSDISYITPNGVPVNVCTVTCPTVTFSVNGGSATTYKDTAHVLDTNGYDFAYNGGNESFQWRPIGTSGTPGGVPEPSTWVMMLMGFAGLAFSGYRARKAVSAEA